MIDNGILSYLFIFRALLTGAECVIYDVMESVNLFMRNKSIIIRGFHEAVADEEASKYP
jgi:hypothetical protein